MSPSGQRELWEPWARSNPQAGTFCLRRPEGLDNPGRGEVWTTQHLTVYSGGSETMSGGTARKEYLIRGRIGML